MEIHIAVISEHNSNNIVHISRELGTALNIATEIIAFLERY